MVNKSLFSSKKHDWETPQWIFDRYDSTYNFTLDVCADGENAKCDQYYNVEIDGLSQEWEGACWMNPPYGREIGKWVKKAYLESRKKNCIVVALLPARTDTKWFHDFIYGKTEIIFLKGRLKFKGAKCGAPFPSMIVVFERNFETRT